MKTTYSLGAHSTFFEQGHFEGKKCCCKTLNSNSCQQESCDNENICTALIRIGKLDTRVFYLCEKHSPWCKVRCNAGDNEQALKFYMDYEELRSVDSIGTLYNGLDFLQYAITGDTCINPECLLPVNNNQSQTGGSSWGKENEYVPNFMCPSCTKNQAELIFKYIIDEGNDGSSVNSIKGFSVEPPPNLKNRLRTLIRYIEDVNRRGMAQTDTFDIIALPADDVLMSGDLAQNRAMSDIDEESSLNGDNNGDNDASVRADVESNEKKHADEGDISERGQGMDVGPQEVVLDKDSRSGDDDDSVRADVESNEQELAGEGDISERGQGMDVDVDAGEMDDNDNDRRDANSGGATKKKRTEEVGITIQPFQAKMPTSRSTGTSEIAQER